MKGSSIFFLLSFPFNCMNHFETVLPQRKNVGG